MKSLKRLSIFAILLTFLSCQSDNNSNVVSQKFVHKYGFDMSENDWESGLKEGVSTTVLENGITVTNTYNNNLLHGPTTYTFANSSIIEKNYVYDNGTLIKLTSQDKSAMPFKEEVYEPNNRTIITLWDKGGVPISIEQYEDNVLINAKYYKPDNELEASIENGTGVRIKRDRVGEMHYKDSVKKGKLKARTTYHPNGQVKSTMSFNNYLLHGEQINYSESGDQLMTMRWDMGKPDGMKTTYKKSHISSEIPYLKGLKHGIERHYHENGRLAKEIHFENGKKHGSHRTYNDNDTNIQWFYKGKEVSLKKFEEFSFREKLVADKTTYFDMIEKMDDKKALQE